MSGRRQILVPLNGSLKPLAAGLKIAEEENCWVTVLKVLPRYEGELDLTGIRDIRRVIDSDRGLVEHALMKSVRGQVAARVRVEQGDLTETINRVAEEEGSDLIILGSHNEGGRLQRFLDNNLARKVRGAASCPVMVVDA